MNGTVRQTEKERKTDRQRKEQVNKQMQEWTWNFLLPHSLRMDSRQSVLPHSWWRSWAISYLQHEGVAVSSRDRLLPVHDGCKLYTCRQGVHTDRAYTVPLCQDGGTPPWHERLALQSWNHPAYRQARYQYWGCIISQKVTLVQFFNVNFLIYIHVYSL